MQIIFRYFAADKFVRKEDGGAVRCRAATRRDTPFEADVRPSGGGREEAAEIKPQDLIRVMAAASLSHRRSFQMEVFLNGTKIPTEAATLSQLIEQQRIPVAGIAVALGSRVVRREQWETTPLEEGCEITVIRATQGG